MASADQTTLRVAILDYLQAQKASVADPDSLAVAIDILLEQWGITPAQRTDNRLPADALLNALPKRDATGDSPLFKKFVDTIKAKGFFDGTAEGTPQYDERLARALEKFKERTAGVGPAPSRPAAAAAPSPAAALSPAPAPSSANNEAAAEAAKEEGNRLLKDGRVQQAIESYTDAIEAAPTGRNAHIYYCNRSAARITAKDFSGAVSDARRAVELDGTFLKAHTRLGAALQLAGRYSEAVGAFEAALRLDAGSSVAKEGLALCRTKVRMEDSSIVEADGDDDDDMPTLVPSEGGEVAGVAGPAGAAGNPLAGLMGALGGAGGGAGGLAGLMHGMGGPGGLAAMMQGMGGLEGLMQNPQMAQMAQSLMSNPQMMQQMMQMMGSMGGPPS